MPLRSAALFGVKPWRLRAWMGHARIEETTGYVHVDSTRMRELPELLTAGPLEQAPERRVLRVLGARGNRAARAMRAAGEKEGVTRG
jgi:hypothetical protein